jgi:hypothetical protein
MQSWRMQQGQPVRCPERFRPLESVRRSMERDIARDFLGAGRLCDEQAQSIQLNAITTIGSTAGARDVPARQP